MYLLTGAGYKRYLKRIVDVVGSIVLIILFFPLFIISSILIKLDSQGPVLADVPERVGRSATLFKMYKFRSMIVNAHNMLREDDEFKHLYQEYKKGSFKLKKDPRITPIGKFIRKHSIDEIPQFFNVLKGEMSLVGPRAYYPDELEDQQAKYPHTRPLVQKVLSVRPGITGLWQVSGRSEINFDKRIAIDAEYVDMISLVRDLQIILKTPAEMIWGHGAV
ncbi:hypothetical protein A3D80_02320 [Candidatus Roizmanbacteria bacterium RIFCSPHIGHO2_02_FULL_40_13b]|uniref:Bacterial sugar transferase domain-containing protein n=1 Tax=Candidatus Roizmanbacteria bacterium RIFCSPHIGHO2_01_FULL_39_24 TaxID=1802032 RepID=A0A1F7GI87_9BACT|nr:MAG: hypothetical protein A2799_03530 [Candidatus Roizmanbacteria bacterium RIFCSPHIGHO2_01_FULL_39_24]OGK27657.1 MAG: hypothetical protein A3D80_02320 [Candidatus Roizmanbacteria bacterium RIFCSPHIGHO2_02_FULL_40_13b]OGK49320.1 MAG: hypothetical protein A3A56_03235 [Candidatus Roizmanbacteria bacterium RIFCSPLOWO2_01_FULL_40_32]OGK57082.1 MAG: hypothetical protein A3H83_02920 [Candidatus Roizmanbacteria bacterium RIFCSPLOWO2_02_FULL_39_8]